MKKHLTTVLLVLIFLIGLSLLLYPTFADYWNSFTQSRAIASYAEEVAGMDEEVYDEIWSAAALYNIQLHGTHREFHLDDDLKKQYEDILNIGGEGIMGYIDIPIINVSLPIYHGTSDGVLQKAIGHLEWTSLPVGGESTHCVLSGHRGLPSARLFTDLDRLVVGDTFTLQVLNEVLTYEVDQILIVEPHETDALQIVEGEDYCTLITCTPYGINTHRLLVRGHRIETAEEVRVVRVTSDALQIEPIIIAPIIAVPLLVLLVIGALLLPGKKNKK